MKKYTKKWTEKENNLILEYYYTLSLPVFLGLFPDRTMSDIKQQVAVLRKANKNFTGEKK
jgi:hypothetical protein